MTAFTWILVLPILQLLSETVHAEKNIVCGNLTTKHCALLYPLIKERANLTSFLITVPSATLLQDPEDPGIIQVFSDPEEWEKIHKYTVDRGLYVNHDRCCVDANNESSELEELRSTGYKPRNVAVNASVENSIDQDSVEGRGDRGKMVSRSSGSETFNTEQRFQRLVRETDKMTEESKEEEGKKELQKRAAESKKKPTGKDSRKKSASKSASKTGVKNGGASSESPPEDKTARRKNHGTMGKSSKMQKSSGTKHPKSRPRRSVVDSSEMEGRLRVARDDSDDDDSALGPDKPKEETKKQKGGEKKKKGSGSGKRGSTSQAASGRSTPKRTEATTKRKASGALAKKKARCKKGGKRCEIADEEDEDEEVTPQTTDEPSTTETGEEMDGTTEEVGESERHQHVKFRDSSLTVPPEPLGKLADYIHRIFNWVKKLETNELRG